MKIYRDSRQFWRHLPTPTNVIYGSPALCTPAHTHTPSHTACGNCRWYIMLLWPPPPAPRKVPSPKSRPFPTPPFSTQNAHEHQPILLLPRSSDLRPRKTWHSSPGCRRHPLPTKLNIWSYMSQKFDLVTQETRGLFSWLYCVLKLSKLTSCMLNDDILN